MNELFFYQMMKKQHDYTVHIQWQHEKGTTDYNSYPRDHYISVQNKPVIEASSDPAFKGNSLKYNPEELFVASIANCHMLWYLHLCAENNIVITAYDDHAKGVMTVETNGAGYFSEVTLFPTVTVSDHSMIDKATLLHQQANKFCFIANSLNFTVHHQPTIVVKKS